MIVLGLTGSIGMGKSTVAAYLKQKGVPVLDADEIVHELYDGEAATLIEAAFPGTTAHGRVDRVMLSQSLLASENNFKKLEAIVHPLVRRKEWDFLSKAQGHGARLAVLEIPLLYETASHTLFDAIVVVSAPAHVQRERVLARSVMTAEKYEAIVARQWEDSKKRDHADFVVDTGLPLEDTYLQIDAVLAQALQRPAIVYDAWQARYGKSA